jgi:autotransporter-associated beta strand protein
MQGTVVFNEKQDFTGVTRISEGRLVLAGEHISPVQLDARGIIAGNAILKGGITLENGLNREGARIEPGPQDQTGTMTIVGNLNLVGRNNLAFKSDQTKNPTSDKLNIEGDLIVNGANNCIIIKILTPLQEGRLTLMGFTGTSNATPESFTVVGLEGIPHSLKIENNQVFIDIQQSRAAAGVVWMGSQSNAWDFKTPNFLYGNASGIFVPGDSIVFTDHAERKNISITETMPVSGMTFTNDTDYSIAGQGVISGEGGLTKSGNGKLSLLNTENTFTGKVEIDGGTLEVASLKDGGLPSSIGASSSASGNWTMKNATLQTRAQMSTNRNMQVDGKLSVNNPNTNNSVLFSGSISGNNVVLELNGKGTLTLQGNNTLGQIVVNDGLLFLGSADGNRYSMGSAKITLNGGTFRMFDINTTSNTGTFSNEVEVPEGKSARWDLPSRWGVSSKLIGSGQIQVHVPYVRSDLNGDWSQFSGRINFTGRDVRLNNAAARNIPLAEVNLGDGTYLMVGNNGSSESATGQVFTFGALSGSGGISGRNSLIVGTKNTNTLYSGAISSGAGQLTKKGTGSLTLSGANSYTGGTSVEGGRLIASNTTGSATGSGTVTVNSGGTLAGTGTIAGAVTVQQGGIVTGGLAENSTGNLKLGSNLVLQSGSTLLIKTNNTQNDLITVNGTITLNGTLEMKNLGASYTAGRSFNIFTAGGAVTGSFEKIEPAVPGERLQWDLSRIAEGIISVANLTSAGQIEGMTVHIHPTMVENICTVSLGNLTDAVQIDLISPLGVILQTKYIGPGDRLVQFDMGRLAKGLYLISIGYEGKQSMHKVLKKLSKKNVFFISR